MAGVLRIIEGGQGATLRRKRAKKPWPGCQQCEIDIGVRSKVLLRTVSSPDVGSGGELTGGYRGLVCAMCLARGKYTPHTA